MIHPLEASNENSPSTYASIYYLIVACDDELPAFDPFLMIKHALLSPKSAQKFNQTVLKFKFVVFQSINFVVCLHCATFASPARLGRIFAPISVIFQVPGFIVFVGGVCVEYVKIILPTFDFCFVQATNTLWALTLSIVLNDIWALLVVACWVNFTNALFQETYLRNTRFMITFTLFEWLFTGLLLVWISVGLVDEMHHYSLATPRGRVLSTKDILVNTMGTMAMMSLQYLYRRYQDTRHKKKTRGTCTTVQALGYRCKVALREVDRTTTTRREIIPSCIDTNRLTSLIPKTGKRTQLQMYLTRGVAKFDPLNTMWPQIGPFVPLSAWKVIVIYSLGGLGMGFATISLFVGETFPGIEVIAVSGLFLSALFNGFYFCCSERQLLKRVVTSFHFLFLVSQIASAGVCIMDVFYWRWAPVCAVVSSLLFMYTILTIDALTPVMKHRLRFKFWIPATLLLFYFIIKLFFLWTSYLLGIGISRTEFDISVLGHRAQFHVAPFLLSRLVTISVWSGRYVYVVFTRQDDNALILLRGEVEFDYEGWKKQARQNTIVDRFTK